MKYRGGRTAGAVFASIALSALLTSSPASAHHSFAAAYDMQDAITITGKVVEVRLTNPHSHFYLDVVDEKGATVRWTFEAGTPSGMLRNGYSPQIIKQATPLRSKASAPATKPTTACSQSLLRLTAPFTVCSVHNRIPA